MPRALRTNTAAVATHDPAGTEAGRQMLMAGGNAVDAAVAAMAALCVALPGSVAFGGYGGSMILYDASTRQTTCIDFDARAPLAYRDEIFAENTKAKANLGYLAVTAPAVVAGLAFALRQFGSKSWGDATHFATELAEDGFVVSAHNRHVLEQWHKNADELSRRAHFADGSIPNVGDRWVQKDLAKLLRRLAVEGPEAFYQPDIARQIVRQVRAHGGILSVEDFTTYQPTLTQPLQIDYRGHTVLTPPAPSGGVTSLQMLRTLEHFDIAAMEPWSAEYLHLVAEVSKECWPDRQVLGDPDFVSISYDDLLSEQRAADRAATVRRKAIQSGGEAVIDDFPHTCNVSVADRFGNLVSMTTTQGAQFGSGVVIEGLGLVLGHGMSRFDFGDPNHPNRPAPHKRPLHNMAPALVLKNGEPFAVLGLPGGTRIPTITAQLVISAIDFDAQPIVLVHAPRVHTDGAEPLLISETTPPATSRALEALGHKLTYGQHALGTPMMLGGPANMIRIAEDGALSAASTTSADSAVVID